jgi:hypothetical protein
MIYDGNKWECKDRENQIIDLIDDNESIIEYKFTRLAETALEKSGSRMAKDDETI